MEVYEDKENGMSHPNIDFDDGEEEDESEETIVKKLSDRRLKAKNRRRRRSSARFLRLGDDNNNGLDEEPSQLSSANLGEVYQNAIRMNAENKINANNSWNLNLIDHLDRFVSASSSSSTDAIRNNTTSSLTLHDNETAEGGVNFTKASCTLDASVKIYSYRVDDVHLTSYKVLANLNRTETGGKNKDKASSSNNDQEMDSEDSQKNRREKRKNAETETLETNLANINIAKLDEAFDIDPLFHKMSKTFDEGGAKGLLLANLGVSLTGCNIVFDSTLDNEEEEEEKREEDDGDQMQVEQNSDINVTSLIQTLEKGLGGQTVHSLPLVPQLASLRQEFEQLKADGFVEKVKPSKRYAAPEEDEIEADRSIHVEAIERSRASQAELGRSMMAEDNDSSLGGGDDDDGPGFDFGGADDYDDHDDGLDTDGFIGTSFIHDGDHRFSSGSFQATFEASQPASQATVLLDAIAAGNITGSDSTYEYFNSQALDNIQGNMWAGAAHWKKMPQRRKQQKDKGGTSGSKNAKNTKSKAKSKRKTVTIFDLKEPVKDINDLLRQPPKGKKGTNPLQLSSAMQKKHAKNDNLLPEDIGLEVDALSTLFMRPKAKIMGNIESSDSSDTQKKHVGFGGVETWNEDASFGGGDDDGPGFDFGGADDDAFGDQDYQIQELEGVRKVEKVRVGYATVAKKVDVKRLKRDLWEELERTFSTKEDQEEQEEVKEEAMDDDDEEEEKQEEDIPVSAITNDKATGPLSFQDTVREMQGTQSQSDVTLPFYFICVLHLANEKGLALESTGLEDFIIHSS